MSSAEEARAFVARFAALTNRLAARNIVVSELECLWRVFGCWRITVQDGAATDRYHARINAGDYDSPGPDVVRFTWDGKDRYLDIEASPTEALSSPVKWKREVSRAFAADEDPLAFVEEYLARRFAN